jgi:hypothetical protein
MLRVVEIDDYWAAEELGLPRIRSQEKSESVLVVPAKCPALDELCSTREATVEAAERPASLANRSEEEAR